MGSIGLATDGVQELIQAPLIELHPDLPIPDLTLELKIGQMLLVGFGGRYLNEDSTVVQDVAAGRIGGVVLFGRNLESPSQVRALTNILQEYAPLLLLVSVDQEGGQVSRISNSFGLSSNYSAQYLGRVDDLALTQRQGESTARALAQAGINLNLAPVVDLNRNPRNPVIGRHERSFSADPKTVAAHAGALIEAHRTEQVFCTLKHFPGHGSSRGDTHYGFVDVSDTWSVVELAPYAALIGQGRCDAIMTAHIFNAVLDPERPATLSERVVNGLLREKLGYNGVIISDDMQMGAIANLYDQETAVRLALEAGVDILAFANSNPFGSRASAARIHAQIVGLVQSGAISPKRIDESYRRILALKQRLAPDGRRTMDDGRPTTDDGG